MDSSYNLDEKIDKIFDIRNWGPIGIWKWNIDVDHCPICKSALN